MRTHADIYKANQAFRNIQRLADFKARRDDFIEKYSKTPDPDYAAYYGADMACWIDAVQTYEHMHGNTKEWWEYREEDNAWLEEQQNIPDILKDQAF
jgi:hypothetical protein